MKLDSHQHFWKYNPADYGWISKEMNVLKKDFLPADLKIELSKIGFDGSIAIQARQNLEETEWLLSLSEKNSFIKGVVGWTDLRAENVEKQLDKYARNKKFVGVRHVLQDEHDDQFMLREDFRRGIKALKKYNIVYDILIYPKHLTFAIDFVKQFPEQVFVLDHIAKPDIKNSSLQPWKDDITMLAQNKNVFCKLSGMVTEANWYSWKPADFTPYLDTVFETFGTDRLMIGSDWPVCTVSSSYSKTMSLVIDYINNLPEADKNKVLGENAIRIYNIHTR